MNVSRLDVMLSVQRALLGYVRPNLRGVCVKFTDITIDLEFYLDDYATEKDEDLLSTVVMYVEADFDNEINNSIISLSYQILSLPPEENLPSSKEWVYRRHEQ
jgi:hypothetical protein